MGPSCFRHVLPGCIVESVVSRLRLWNESDLDVKFRRGSMMQGVASGERNVSSSSSSSQQICNAMSSSKAAIEVGVDPAEDDDVDEHRNSLANWSKASSVDKLFLDDNEWGRHIIEGSWTVKFKWIGTWLNFAIVSTKKEGGKEEEEEKERKLSIL